MTQERPAPQARNRTNVRSYTGARLAFRILARVSPRLAAAALERLFFTPPRPRRSRGDAVLHQGESYHVLSEGRRIAAWRWGQGPVVVLLHGWGGRAAQLSAFVAPLVNRGFSVVAFDAPGHGASGRCLSSAPQFAQALRAVAAGDPVHGILTHSLGAAGTALAIRDGLRVGRVVFLAPPADPPSWVATLAARLGIPSSVVDALRARSERRLRMRWEDLHLVRLAAGFDASLLVIHDRDDGEVPPEDGHAVAAAWPGARLLETTGLGHNRLLRDPLVIAHAVDFLAEDVVAACECGAPLDRGTVCESCRIEQELFHREARWASLGAPAPWRPPTRSAGRGSDRLGWPAGRG
jgi:pimeloyl-ACP methyl ester carboxylesterase